MTNLNAATTSTNSTSTISAPMMHDTSSESVQTHQISSAPGTSNSASNNNVSASTSSSSTSTRHQNSTTTAINQLGPIAGSTSTNSINSNINQINQQLLASSTIHHLPNETSQTSRISIDTLTRHDRKQNNHHSDTSDTVIILLIAPFLIISIYSIKYIKIIISLSVQPESFIFLGIGSHIPL